LHCAVIGSGPAGIACAKGLTARGFKVTILDIGEQLPAKTDALAKELAAMPVKDWPQDVKAELSRNPTIKDPIPRKLYFGSDFAYGTDKPYAPLDSDNSAFLPSVGRGGYSTVWGAASLPVADCDIKDWPLTRQDLEPYYREILNWMPVSGGDGTIETAYPSFTERLGRLPLDRQSEKLLADLKKSESKHNPSKFVYGEARLAVDPGRCDPCGMCLSGCPRQAIYDTSETLNQLVDGKAVVYRPRQVVHSVNETPAGVEIIVEDLESQSRQTLTFDAAFIGAGALGTARLLLNSKRLFNESLTLRQSSKFLIPILRAKGVPSPWAENALALSRVFIEFKVQGFADNWFHVQVSSMNQMMLEALNLAPDQSRSWKRFLASPVLNRLMVAWCGIHSDHSAQISVSLSPPDTASEPPTLISRAKETEKSVLAGKRAARTLFRNGLSHGTLFLSPMSRLSAPGTGYHCGGSFPHRHKKVSTFETDLLGRPFDWENIYVIGGSVLPSIPATTIAFTIMVNALRIATQVPIASGKSHA